MEKIIKVMITIMICMIVITPVDVNAANKKVTVKLSKTSFTYTGKNITPAVTVKYGKKVLTKKNYKVIYKDKRKEVGTYSVRIVLKGKYKKEVLKGEIIKNYIIKPLAPKVSTDVSTNSITLVLPKKLKSNEYQINTRKNGGSKVTKITTKKKKYKIKDIADNTAYDYRVRVCKKVNGKKIWSPWTTWKTIKTSCKHHWIDYGRFVDGEFIKEGITCDKCGVIKLDIHATSESEKTTEIKTEEKTTSTTQPSTTTSSTEKTTSTQSGTTQTSETSTENSTETGNTESTTCVHEWEDYGHNEGVITGFAAHQICLTCGAYIDGAEAQNYHSKNYHGFAQSTVFVPIIESQYIVDGQKCKKCGATNPAPKKDYTTCQHEWQFLDEMELMPPDKDYNHNHIAMYVSGEYCPKCGAVKDLGLYYLYIVKHPEMWSNTSANVVTNEQITQIIQEYLKDSEYYNNYANSIN